MTVATTLSLPLSESESPRATYSESIRAPDGTQAHSRREAGSESECQLPLKWDPTRLIISFDHFSSFDHFYHCATSFDHLSATSFDHLSATSFDQYMGEREEGGREGGR